MDIFSWKNELYLLQNAKKIKYRKKDRLSSKIFIDPGQYEREISLYFGSVWGVNDNSVPFDSNRNEDDYKNSLRPCLVLKTPESFTDSSLVWTAPGTSKKHKYGKDYPPCFLAEEGKEEVKHSTYFLLYFSWMAKQITAQKRLFDLSVRGKEVLSIILKKMGQL